MKKKPWEEEIALCDLLISYLQGLEGKKKVAASASPVADPAPAPRQVDKAQFEGLAAVGKKSNELGDFLNMGGAKKKSKKKKSKPKKSGITHAPNTINSFSMLDLSAPIKMEDIPASIKQLQEKRAYYDVLPRAPKQKKAEQAKPASKPARPEPLEAPGEDSFPVLPGSKSPATRPLTPSGGVSAVDMVKSSDNNLN